MESHFFNVLIICKLCIGRSLKQTFNFTIIWNRIHAFFNKAIYLNQIQSKIHACFRRVLSPKRCQIPETDRVEFLKTINLFSVTIGLKARDKVNFT